MIRRERRGEGIDGRATKEIREPKLPFATKDEDRDDNIERAIILYNGGAISRMIKNDYSDEEETMNWTPEETATTNMALQMRKKQTKGQDAEPMQNAKHNPASMPLIPQSRSRKEVLRLPNSDRILPDYERRLPDQDKTLSN